MIKVNEKLTVLYDIGDFTFTDFSNKLVDYSRGEETFPYEVSTDSLYVGFKKPINVFYTDLSTVNTELATMSLSYYNGSSFTAVTGLFDDTDGFKRSGFTSWDRGLTDEATTTLDSKTLFWYKVDFDINLTAETAINGLNIVFSDDVDLKREVYEISKYLPAGETSHILSHVAARDEVIQNLNIVGRKKVDANSEWLEGITSFDLLDISEAKLASTYLTLHKIMLAASDDPSDIYGVKSMTYRDLATNILSNMSLKVDTNDDGKYQRDESTTLISGTIKRL